MGLNEGAMLMTVGLGGASLRFSTNESIGGGPRTALQADMKHWWGQNNGDIFILNLFETTELMEETLFITTTVVIKYT